MAKRIRKEWVHTTNGNTIGFLMGNPGHEVHHEVDAVGCLVDPDVAAYAIANYPVAKGKGEAPAPVAEEAGETHEDHEGHEDSSEDHDAHDGHGEAEEGTEDSGDDEPEEPEE